MTRPKAHRRPPRSSGCTRTSTSRASWRTVSGRTGGRWGARGRRRSGSTQCPPRTRQPSSRRVGPLKRCWSSALMCSCAYASRRSRPARSRPHEAAQINKSGVQYSIHGSPVSRRTTGDDVGLPYARPSRHLLVGSLLLLAVLLKGRFHTMPSSASINHANPDRMLCCVSCRWAAAPR